MTPPRLSATRDQYYATANNYDATGNRAWTLRLRSAPVVDCGKSWIGGWSLSGAEGPTWYQSDLVTITDQAMTKHYFIAGAALSLSKRQRIASKLAESLAPEVAQALKEKPVTPLSGDIRDLAEATATRIARDFDCVGLDYNAFYPGGLRLRSATVVHCNECRIEGRSLSGAEGRSLSCVEGYALYV